MTQNTTQKILIKNLTQTHQDAAAAYRLTLEQVAAGEKEKVLKIAKTLKVELNK